MVKDHKRKAILHFELYATFFSGVMCLVILADSMEGGGIRILWTDSSISTNCFAKFYKLFCHTILEHGRT
jgi:hypothetical protein